MFLDMYQDGYEPKCKICNSKFQDEIEKMREENQTYEDIQFFMKNKGEQTSLMSISRHFNKHYPVRKRYIEEENLRKQKEIEDNERLIQTTIKSFPYLQEILKEEVSWDYECPKDNMNKQTEELPPKTFKDVFLNHCGYCTTGYKFCENVPKKQVYCVSDALFNLEMESAQNQDIHPIYSLNPKLNLLEKKLKCANCTAFYNDALNEFILYFLIRKMFKHKIEPEEFRRSFINKLECDNEKTYKSLSLNNSFFI